MSVLFAVQLVLSDLNIVFAVLEQWETVWISGLGGFKRYVSWPGLSAYRRAFSHLSWLSKGDSK